MPVQEHIRNFSIIAHIDHGKSTLADRILEITGLVSEREKRDQYLDRMDIERERGITIKAQSVRIPYKSKNGKQYLLNLIDTPGHVDFNYEVSRSLAACEGALLVVDATQGVEAQTLANVYLALDHNHEIIPVLNKIDLPSSDVERVKSEIEEDIGLDCSKALPVSAKTGDGVPDVLEAIVERLPAPEGNPNAPLKALIFDSWYDSYQGVVVMFRIMDGTLRKGDKIELFATKKTYEVIRLGVFSPESRDMDQLSAGEVGFLCGNIKELGDAKVGDTITLAERPCAEAVPGFKEVKAVVFCGLYPSDPSDYEQLKFALEKLQLNDAAFSWEPETSQALGFGFRCGFLGLLHMEIIQERLEREFQVDLIATAPSVIYRVETTDGKTTEIDNPSKLPDPARITNLYEPYVRIDIHVPSDYVGNVMKLCEEKRGIQKNMGYRPEPRRHHLRAALCGNRVRLLRPPEVRHARLRLNGLRSDRLPGLEPRASGYPPERRSRGRPRGHRAQGQILRLRACACPQAQAHHPAPDVRSGDSGRHRPEGHRPRNHFRAPQERNRQVLRRRHYP